MNFCRDSGLEDVYFFDLEVWLKRNKHFELAHQEQPINVLKFSQD